MICSKCGSKVADGVKFCPICGNEFPEIKVSTEDQSAIFVGSTPEPRNNTASSGYGQQNYSQQDYNYQNTTQNQGYNQNYNQNYYQNQSQYTNPSDLTEDTLPDNLKPLSPWAYLGYYLLFTMVPCAGLILAIVFAFSSGDNVNRRNFARFYLLMLAIGFIIGLFMTIIMFSLGAGVVGDIFKRYY